MPVADVAFAVDGVDHETPWFAQFRRLPAITRRGLDHADRYMPRDYFDVFVPLEGESDLHVLDVRSRRWTIPIRPGHLYFWRPQDRRSLAPHRRSTVTALQVCFAAGLWREFTDLARLDPLRFTASPPIHVPLGHRRDAVIEQAARMVESSSAPGPPMGDLIRFWLEILPLLLAATPETGSRTAPDWLTVSVRDMHDEENLLEGLPRFVELACVSPRQLARATARHFGATPSALVAELRLRRAIRLLTSTDESIGGIAARCGYANASSFSNRFRERMSLSPLRYRELSSGGFVEDHPAG